MVLVTLMKELKTIQNTQVQYTGPCVHEDPHNHLVTTYDQY